MTTRVASLNRDRLRRGVATVAATLIGAVYPWGEALSSTDSASAYTAAFETMGALDNEEVSLGVSAATYLNLQLWRTLLIPIDADGNLNFSSNGTVWWGRPRVAIASHASAERAARDVLAQMTLWGVAFEYGDGVVVQPYLSVPRYNDFREDYNERWSLEPFDTRIEVDMPRRRYDFSPIELSKASVTQLTGPFAFDICQEDGSDCTRGELSGGFTAMQHNPKCTKVKRHDDGEEGWICGAIPSERESEVVDFVAGILRVMRADWGRAEESFQKVIDNSDAEIRLQVDARLYLAMSRAKSERPADSIMQEAFDLNPNDQVTFKYLIMSKLATWKKEMEQGQASDALADELERLLVANRVLLAKDDPWLTALDTILKRAKNQRSR